MSRTITSMKTLVAASVTSLLALTVSTPSHAADNDTTLAQVLKRNELRVGVLDGFKPWAFRDSDGHMKGIALELGQKVADALEVKFTPVVVSSANRIDFLRQGRVDLLMAGMYDTSDRRKQVHMIEPAYWASGPTLMAKKGLIKSWDDIKGKPICVKQGTYYNPMVQKRFGATLITFPGNTEAKTGLKLGKCVAWLYDDAAVAQTLASDSWAGYEMPVQALYSNPWAAAVKPGKASDSLADVVTGLIYTWQSNGTLIELSKKWGVKPTQWLQETHKQLHWNTDYLTAH